MNINAQHSLASTLHLTPYLRVSQSIGNTPLMQFLSLPNGSKLYLKLEQFNPTGSAKIRMAKSMLDEAEASGQLKPGAGSLSQPPAIPVLVLHCLQLSVAIALPLLWITMRQKRKSAI
ncbi:pyridoxal-phosphate dependent enzyme [Pseudoalteromonas piscicida]|uniref:pyridoxal-phosphate dependent enzyme n=1 Tax=Pseudoalteromonas piscicida TaxID=43662 RepID=UPI0027E48987|nr:pyridoxal-phosphate dependent enzyme [Pseudoalteromonas piscicida]WMO13182.1 pyridoxal-phosphate dependent enzyme [Pseudoalteromonas piscicida]